MSNIRLKKESRKNNLRRLVLQYLMYLMVVNLAILINSKTDNMKLGMIVNSSPHWKKQNKTKTALIIDLSSHALRRRKWMKACVSLGDGFS